ncbi:hypothetical protein GCM10027067_41260 [Pseudactinotalea suaedae]
MWLGDERDVRVDESVVQQLLDPPRRRVLLLGDLTSDIAPVLEDLGCDHVQTAPETVVETALAMGAINAALVDPALLATDRTMHAVADLRALYPQMRVLLAGAPHELPAELLVQAIRGGLHDIIDPTDREGLRGALQTCLLRSEQEAERVLAIGAHPDDVEIGSAGALLEHRRRGDHVAVLTLSRGDVGGDRNARVGESVTAATQIGARLLLADLPDTQIDQGIDTIRLIEAVVGALKPTVVYVHSRHDNHQDHRAVNTATMSATRSVAQVFAYQSPSATNEFSPTRFVPIDAVVTRKVDVLSSFASQSERTYLEPELIVAGARYWARHLAPLARYAEPFEVIRSFIPRRAALSAPAQTVLSSPGPVAPMALSASHAFAGESA